MPNSFYQCEAAKKLVDLNWEQITIGDTGILTRNDLLFFIQLSGKVIMMCAKIVFTWILKTDICSSRLSCNSV